MSTLHLKAICWNMLELQMILEDAKRNGATLERLINIYLVSTETPPVWQSKPLSLSLVETETHYPIYETALASEED